MQNLERIDNTEALSAIKQEVKERVLMEDFETIFSNSLANSKSRSRQLNKTSLRNADAYSAFMRSNRVEKVLFDSNMYAIMKNSN